MTSTLPPAGVMTVTLPTTATLTAAVAAATNAATVASTLTTTESVTETAAATIAAGEAVTIGLRATSAPTVGRTPAAAAEQEAGEPTGVPPTGMALNGGERPLLVTLLVIVGLAVMAGAGRKNRRRF